MEPVPQSEQVSSAVRQHEAIQDNVEQALNQQPNPPPYSMAAANAQYGGQYGGQYGSQYGVNQQPVVTTDVHGVHAHAPHQQVSQWLNAPHQQLGQSVPCAICCAIR